MLCRLIAHHSCAIIEAEERGLADILSREFKPAPDELSSVLTYCDMTTSPDGELVPAEKRLAKIQQRYGPGHLVSRSIHRATPMILLADAQPTPPRRMRANGLLCLGAGAGLIRADLRDVHGTDVTCRSGGVIVTVRGARPRAVPVLACCHGRLLAAAASAGTGLICGGTDPGRRNITTPLIRSLAGGAGLPRLDTSRLRATWLADVAGLLGLTTFMHAAGITCSQRLGDLLASLEPAAEADAVRLLGAARRP